MTGNLILGPILSRLTQIWSLEDFLEALPLLVDIISNYHHMQFKGKLMNQTWENGKKN